MTPKTYNTFGWILYILILVVFSIVVFMKNKGDIQMVVWSIGGATLLCIITGLVLYSPNVINQSSLVSLA